MEECAAILGSSHFLLERASTQCSSRLEVLVWFVPFAQWCSVSHNTGGYRSSSGFSDACHWQLFLCVACWVRVLYHNSSGFSVTSVLTCSSHGKRPVWSQLSENSWSVRFGSGWVWKSDQRWVYDPASRRRMMPPTLLQNSYSSFEEEQEHFEEGRDRTVIAKTKQYLEEG